MITILACIISFFFAINIGASGAAASMGIAYGSGAVKTRKLALFICAAGVFAGAVLGGGEVVKTLGSEIVPEHIISIPIASIILSSAAVSLFIANLSGIPLSTSEVTVGAIVGVGIAFKVLFVDTLFVIVLYWLFIPFIAFLLAFGLNKLVRLVEARSPFLLKGPWPKLLACLVVFTGFLEAFSAGMNNVANSVGPLVASGLISIGQGTLAGGLFVALGAFFLGGKVIETNGKKITELSLLQGSAVSGIGAALVIISSLFGIPVPHTQVTTCSILGVGVSDKGAEIWKKAILAKLIKTWVISPLFSLVISYNLVKIFIDFDFTGLVMIIVFIAIVGLLSLWKPANKSRVIYDKKIVLNKQEVTENE
ncbi:inorganic phosphate transporter [Sediminibacillus albus]|uniref:Phosphate transporter n=1 Tax=Sediminibacillus albus TaxID=407036 RepID=A0A1G8X3Q2_9BACI|nr:inorganic phosphate transporter [Sediminibacillus albus]SDJ84936.1 sulfate permease [Sediminibacillus albus]